MDNLSKEYIIDFFSKKLSLFGNAPASVGWTAEGQRLRYECIISLLPLQGSSVLDFGCGKGDFYGFIRQKGIEADYTGIDINKKLIEVAAGNYREGRFLALDIDSEELTETFDYIILCGVFNLNTQRVKESAETIIGKLFHHTRKTLLFNCLSAHSRTKDTNLVYFDPVEVLSTALKNTKSVNLYHSHIAGDIFLLLNKELNALQPSGAYYGDNQPDAEQKGKTES
ncbi:MAG: class I SAM-dependent methyltransferase [Nitrospiraceae bacterium]|nr:MAG: class I SAM-dependent methyltransferase [Nitrospiraceae bacterium]